MKKQITKMLTVALLFAATIINAQAPQGFNYQAVVRDASGNLITSGTVTLDFIIRKTSTSGTTVYKEWKTLTPNPYGLVTHVIGTGTVLSGTFATIAWSTDKFYIETTVNGVSVSNDQFQSVPYALNAKTADALTGGSTSPWTVSGNNISNSNSGNVGIGTTSPLRPLHLVAATNTEPLYIKGSPSEGRSIFFAPATTGSSWELITSSIGMRFCEAGVACDRFFIGNGGKIGIGLGTPTSPLTVAVGSGYTTASLVRVYFNQGMSTLQSGTSTSGNIQIEARGYMWANNGGFVATSDKRVKNIMGLTDTKKDLADLNQIEITDYKYIDEIGNGNRLHKKVIAQQVNSIYPNAVMTNKGMVPNVYEVAEQVTVKGAETLIETKKPHTFENGDEVKLILAQSGEKTVCVNVINAHQFTVDEAINDKVFVYGKKVNDLMMVDYDALTTLNISATQELYKRIVSLETENAGLKAELNAATTSLKADMELVKAQLGIRSQNNTK